MSSSVDQIKSKIDIVSLVSSYMKLEKAGANFKGKCPFHNEKTPSFFVSPDRGSYYCFGCQAKGDIFTFVEEFEGLDFLGALKVLADRAGVVLEKYNTGEKTEKDRLYSVLDQAVFFYQKKLSESKLALDYLKSRGVSDKTIKEFRIGYSSPEWRELLGYLKLRGVSDDDMLKTGLIKSPSLYDTFRGRVMFPINDSSGRAVAFSGRILVADDTSTGSKQANAPKYLNSPETVLFNKSEILFGLDKAKKDIRLKDYSILVEGQMDLIMLHQVGFTNTVAGSGTALTAEHLTKLRRLSSRIIMAYDSDSAGFLASNRSAQIALSLGMELKIAEFPKGKDPADLAKDDQKTLKESIKNSKHIIDFYTDNLLGRKLEGRELGLEIKKNVLPYVAILTSAIEKSHFVKNIAHKTFIKEEALWDDLKQTESSSGFNSGQTNSLEANQNQKVNFPTNRTDAIERKVVGIIMWQKEKGDSSIEILEFENKTKEILKNRFEEILLDLEKEKETLLFETEMYYNDKSNLEKDIKELLISLEEEYLKKDFTLAMLNLQKAESLRNNAEILKYLEICQIISQRINLIKNAKK